MLVLVVVVVVVVGSAVVVLEVVVVVVVGGVLQGTLTISQVSLPSQGTLPQVQGEGQLDEIISQDDPFHFRVQGSSHAPVVVVLVDVDVVVGHP